MPKLKIDGVEVEVEDGMSVLQACELVGVEVPRFCYHDRLTVPANCRMCLVEQNGVPKPIASCALRAAEGMEISTTSEMVQKARKGTLELMLINHPLDCPICDQGGECDLQDQAMAFGYDRSRYQEEKRAVEDKNFGPLIKTAMTRCIHCTRCVRFAEQIGGEPELGLLGRGEDAEIGTFVQKFVTSELSGNLTDVCPVGALLSKPYSFKARPWEMRKTESIDVMDAVGSAIRVDTRSNAEVMRILPRLNEDVNEEWISDKTRFAYDGLKMRRLDRPYIRRNGELVEATWDEALMEAAGRLQETDKNAIAALVGNQADCEAITVFKDMMTTLDVPHLDCRTDGAEYDVSSRSAYIMNSTIAGIDDCDAILLVGTFPRHEATMVNARIRRAWFERKIPVGVIGEEREHTYPTMHIGTGPKTLEDLAKGGTEFAAVLENAQKPLVIVGAGALARRDGAAIQALVSEVAQRFNAEMNVLQLAASRVGALDLGFLPQTQDGMATLDILQAAKNGAVKTLYLLGVDEIDPEEFGDAFIIYQGHHGDVMAEHADIILPGAAYTEKTALYVNTEGRVQQARQAMHPVGQAREDWKIFYALTQIMGKELPYATIGELRAHMAAINPVFAHVDHIMPTQWKPCGKAFPVDNTPFERVVMNFYQTCAISRASATMEKCTQEFVAGRAPLAVQAAE